MARKSSIYNYILEPVYSINCMKSKINFIEKKDYSEM